MTQGLSALVMLWRRCCLILVAAWAGLVSLPASSQPLRDVPVLNARVIDQTGSLSDVQRQALEQKLADFESRSGPQIVILLVPATAPEDIAAFAFRVADQWKIGRRDVGDGLVVLVAKDERRVRLEVARALEGAVPDLAARQIIDQAMVPAFRQGDYAGGLQRAVDMLIARISGEGLPAPAARPSPGVDPAAWGPGLGALLLGAVVVVSVLRAVIGPGRTAALLGSGSALGGWWWGGPMLGVGLGLGVVLLSLLGVGTLLQLVLSSRGGGSGGWGGGGGGGFSSGGGGSFGGGGASGNW